MKILLVAGPNISLKEPYDSGIEAFIVSFATQLITEGHNVTVVAALCESCAKFKLVNPFSASSSEQSDLERAKEEEYQFTKLFTESYDIVHYNMFYPHLLNAGLHIKNNSVLTLHSPPDANRISVYKNLLTTSNIKFVAISTRIKNQYDEALGLKIPLINNGIDLYNWPMNQLRQRKYLLWSARITEEKNVAAAIRLAQYMRLPLIIAGRIVNQKYFDEEVKPHLNDQIQYVGHITQYRLMELAKNAITFLATATWQEPFGLAALEMLASGVPVVGFNAAVPQNWENKCVLTIASTSWEDLIELVLNSYSVDTITCRDFASGMTIQKMTSEYLELYQHILLNTPINDISNLATECIVENSTNF